MTGKLIYTIEELFSARRASGCWFSWKEGGGSDDLGWIDEWVIGCWLVADNTKLIMRMPKTIEDVSI